MTPPPSVEQEIGRNQGYAAGVDDRSTGQRQTLNLGEHPYDSLYSIGRRIDSLEVEMKTRLLALEREATLLREAAENAIRVRQARSRETQWGISLLLVMVIGFALIALLFAEHLWAP